MLLKDENLTQRQYDNWSHIVLPSLIQLSKKVHSQVSILQAAIIHEASPIFIEDIVTFIACLNTLTSDGCNSIEVAIQHKLGRFDGLNNILEEYMLYKITSKILYKLL